MHPLYGGFIGQKRETGGFDVSERNGGRVHFLLPNKKRTKEIGLGEALSFALPRAKAALP